MRFEPECKHGANAGLDIARERLAKIQEKYPKITTADLWSLAGLLYFLLIK
jgi:cytochrome c peroxidase